MTTSWCTILAAALTPHPAVAYVVRAFDRFPIVAVGEAHGAPETQAFIARVIEHPDFAGRVSDIVVESATRNVTRSSMITSSARAE